MLMLHASSYVEEAERLIAELEALEEKLKEKDSPTRGDYFQVISERPRLIQRAALELRMGFEKTAYKALQARKKSFNANLFKDWRANKIVQFVSDIIDENFAFDSVIRFCVSGEEEDPNAWKTAVQRKGIKKRQFSEFYNALGQLLHIADDSVDGRKFPQFPRVSNEQRAIEKIKEIIEYFRSFEGYGDAHFQKEVVTKRCDCGTEMSRPVRILKIDNIVECPNPDCDREWSVTDVNGEIEWRDAKVTLACPSCGFKIPLRESDYAEFRAQLNKRVKPFRAGDQITKNFMCLNPECSKSVVLAVGYSYSSAGA